MRIYARLLLAKVFTAKPFSAAVTAAKEVAADSCSEATASESKPKGKILLLKRLSSLEANRNTLWQTLDQFIHESSPVKRCDLEWCVKYFRRFQQYHHSIEILLWMENRGIKLSSANIVLRINLISRTEGIAATESYFDGLPASRKNQFTYESLLNCYCKEKMTFKALSLFVLMDRIGWANFLAFNNLMYLFLRLNQLDKVRNLVEVMRVRGISPHTINFIYWMNSYARLDDIVGVENVVKMMKRENKWTGNLSIQLKLASIYVNAGIYEKAKLVLETLEVNKDISRRSYHILIRLYAKISDYYAVHRQWDALKLNFEVSNMSYRTMLLALTELDDVYGLRNCFQEWESSCSTFDLRVVNVTIRAYLKWNMVDDAQKIFHLATERSSGPFIMLRESFVEFFLKGKCVSFALEHMKAAVFEALSCKWRPSPDIVKEFFIYLEEKQNFEGAMELCKLLKKICCLDFDSYQSLVKIFIAADMVPPNTDEI